MTLSTPLQWRDNDGCPAVEQPIMTFIRLIREKMAICHELEQVADNLPSRIDSRQCAILAAKLPGLLKLCDDIHQQVIFPLLLREQSQRHFTRPMAERLIGERLMDQGYAIEVGEFLGQLANAEAIGNVEASGYMLRGFFEVVRRSCAFDLEYIIPLTQRYSTDGDLIYLAAMLKEKRFVVAEPCTLTRQALRSRMLN